MNHGSLVSFATIRVYTLTRNALVVMALAVVSACHVRAASPPRISHDHSLATLEKVAGWANAEDTVVLALATQYFSSHRDEDGFAWFAAAAERRPERPLLLALSGLFRARMADEIPLRSRVSWVDAALARLDTAAQRDPGLSRVVRALALARLPERFGRQHSAVAELEWALGDAKSPVVDETEPSTVRFGLRRACLQSLAAAKSAVGDVAGAATALHQGGVTSFADDAPLVATGWSVDEKSGFRFGTPRLLQPAPRVYLATGYDFSDIAFVVTSAGVVAIDAGTRPETTASALAAFRKVVPSPPLRAVIVTHAHWDHIGGLSALLGPDVAVIAQSHAADELAKVNEVNPGFHYFFGKGARAGAYELAPTQLIAERTTWTMGDVAFDLMPAHGGETNDALLVRLPESETVFVGDVMMPYLGAPFVGEGSPEGLLDTLTVLESLHPKLLLHGHQPLTDFYTVDVLAPLGEALRAVADATRAGVRAGQSLSAILDEELAPDVLSSHPRAVMPYLLMRDQFATRLERQLTGYWQPGGEGVEPRSRAESQALLVLLADHDRDRMARVAADLTMRGDLALALEVADAGLTAFPNDAGPRSRTKTQALDGLRVRNGQLNPFKFIIYSELEGVETAPLEP